MLKRTFDICFSSAVLLMLAPLGLGLALWIKIDSRGPVIFRQTRVGRHGRLFQIYKLRTMRTDASEGGAQITVGADPRITRAGAFLRKHKLDELPQFVNVWVGDMSVVGPRPEVPRYVAHYPADARELILSVRPGITDMASLAYRDESALLAAAGAEDPEAFYVREVLPAKLALCLKYVRERSLWLDLRIVGCTVAAVFGGAKG
jgi:lipopolysaccharide/colanic/teichoic acid biosynthesis glycosyltransferase